MMETAERLEKLAARVEENTKEIGQILNQSTGPRLLSITISRQS